MNKLTANLLVSTVFLFSSSVFAETAPNSNAASNTKAQPVMEVIEVTEEITPAQKAKAPFHAAREKLNHMTPEERKAFQEQARAKWQSLSPQEKQKFKVKMREKMELMKKQDAERKMVKIYTLYLIEEGQQ